MSREEAVGELMSITHEHKLDPKSFEAVKRGKRKALLIHSNEGLLGDQPIREGDYLRLHEWQSLTGYANNDQIVVVTDVYEGNEVPKGHQLVSIQKP